MGHVLLFFSSLMSGMQSLCHLPVPRLFPCGQPWPSFCLLLLPWNPTLPLFPYFWLLLSLPSSLAWHLQFLWLGSYISSSIFRCLEQKGSSPTWPQSWNPFILRSIKILLLYLLPKKLFQTANWWVSWFSFPPQRENWFLKFPPSNFPRFPPLIIM